jgi:hypothetical protein
MQRPNSLAHQHQQQQQQSQQSQQQQQQQSQQHRHHQRHHYQRQSSHQNMNNNNINSNDYNIHMPSNWIVNDDTIRDVPNFYPLEKSSKFIKDHPSHIANRISECCRAMSVQACFDNDLATADLKTSEHVEIHISLWKSPDENDDEKINANGDENANENENADTNTNTPNTPITIVEAQRRKGDAVTYHKYCRNILAAAVGSFSFQDYIHQSNLEEVIKLERQQSLIEEIQKEKQKKKLQFLELQKQNKSKGDGGGDHDIGDHDIGDDIGNLKDDNEHDDKGDSMGTNMGMGMGMSMNSSFLPEGEDSLLALEIAASLLKKDRMDARQLGMETLCLLTDPAKTGIDTALLTSKVVLFGSVDAGNDDIDFGGAGGTGHDDDDDDDDDYMPAEDLGVREAILSLVQFGRLGEYIDFEEEEEEHDGAGGGTGTGTGGADLHPEEKDFNALLHNLALVVLENALDVLEQHGREMAIVEVKNILPMLLPLLPFQELNYRHHRQNQLLPTLLTSYKKPKRYPNENY